ncbi:hypothetical protein GOB94_07210 [Granulicella sp. 5B5]|uniref:PepSY-associated TM helix domain-containing protein n=1 Tax=Granulicella sp. 5B5 TaxID=1617967 RepID=UPI0015F67137|nr:PepSY-associated TM helix domain-containing protein [Granulicella sp. 5B5]QMV18496.1 hypothetical protein GOB94_07210 [Granulicella sp. 5B5]
MSFLATLRDHPRKLWIRRALFQIHLWAGVVLSLYLIVISLSGSVLVFEDELTGTTLPHGLSAFDANHVATIPQVVAAFHKQHHDADIDLITVPTKTVPAFQLNVHFPGGQAIHFVADPLTGQSYKQGRTWVQWVHDLHVSLLLNENYGMQVNAVGAAVLLLLVLTGVVLWWPGLRAWTRGLRVNFQANWRRINFDLHNAIGFWTLTLVFWWAFSGVYFGFYRQVAAVVNAVAPLRNMRPPIALAASGSTVRLPLEQIVGVAQSASLSGRLYSLSNPSLVEPVVYASMDLRGPGNFLYRDIVQIDASDGRVLSIWHYSYKHGFGDWILWLMQPLHFGTMWGTTIKVIWAASGLALALLTITGLLMYWNRVLRRSLSR